MPELPDVEGLRRLFAGTAAGRTVAGVHVPAPEILRNTTPQALGRALSGRVLGDPTRHGKWLFAPTRGKSGDGPVLLMHFGMDGGLEWAEGARDRPPSRYDRLILQCDGGELRYRSVRKLGGLWLLHSAREAGDVTGPLGPDAFGLDLPGLTRCLEARRGGVKSALMDQSRVAGLGNLTVDELLWRARVHPKTPAAGITNTDFRRLHAAMRDVLAGSVRAGRVPDWDGWLTKARAEPAPACPRCGTSLSRGRVAGRTTVWCPRCQS